MRQVMAACILSAVALTAEQLPHLQPRVILPGESVAGTFWLTAPDIVVATVISAERAGPDVEITPGKLKVHLVGVKAGIENVIEGNLSRGLVRFYFFTNTLTPNEGYTTPLSWFEPGKRYVLFLRRDGSVLRTMADLTEPNIRIWSGHHDQNMTSFNQSGRPNLGVAIAGLALTPPTDREKGFAVDIDDIFNRLLLIASPSELALFIKKLLSYPDQEIQERACLALSVHFSYTDPCFDTLLESANPVIKQQAAIWAPRKHANRSRLRKALRENPISLSISGKVEDLASDLELFTFDSDVGVRQQACDTVHRLFPSTDFSNCAMPGPNHGVRP